jgi:uncharacterized protein involved in exopolysaccharide biosynthesis
MSRESDQLSVSELVHALWEGRWIVLALTAFFTLSASVAAFSMSKRYTAVAVVAPAERSSQSGLGGLAARFGGLASLAGISLPADESASEAIATLESDGLTIDFIQSNSLLPIIFSSDWDSVNSRWATQTPPTLWGANQLFKSKVRSVVQDAKSGLIYVSATWNDPKVAEKWANEFVQSTNSYLRGRAIEQSARNIEYLKKELESTSALELRAAIYSLMESEIQKGMLARGNDEFALRVLDNAIAPEKPSFPRPSVWIPVGFVGGLFLSMLLVVVRGTLRPKQRMVN